MQHRLLAAIGIAAMLAVFGCSNDATSPPADQTQAATAPALPPASTMSIDLEFPESSEQPGPTAEDIRSGKPGPGTLAVSADHFNWINALTRALYLVLVTADHLEEPMAAFALAMHSVPQRQDDGSFLWTYIFVDQETDVEYEIFLYGLRGEDSVLWRLEVSTDDETMPLDHFVWFTGESAEDGQSGYWQFYTPVGPTEGTEVARIDWLNDRNEKRLTITANGEGAETEGDVLDFHATRAVSTIDYYDASEDLDSNITWYRDGSGSLTVPDYNGGETACWDTRQRDVACE